MSKYGDWPARERFFAIASLLTFNAPVTSKLHYFSVATGLSGEHGREWHFALLYGL